MSYLVLARRWRPRKFTDMVGQPHVARTLLNGLVQQRVAHAYLFSGPRGVGKTTTARLLAHALNCLSPVEGEPCGTCSSCVSITEGNFIDVIEIDAASNRGIDDIRSLREGVRYAPLEGRAKIYIIDEVHMLTNEAFNALLKTLEEPPSHAYFCMATTDPQKVPQTIHSRCQRFDFRQVSLLEIRNHLENICKSEQLNYELEALDIIARRADGSVRDSLSLLDQVISFSGGTIHRQDAVDVIGEIRLDLYFRAVELIQRADPAEAFRLDSDLAIIGTDPHDFLIGLENHLVQLLQIKTGGVDKSQLSQEYADQFLRSAESLSVGDIIRLLQLCSQAETDIRRNFNRKMRLQLLLLKFATFESTVVLSDLIRRVEAGGGTGSALRPPAQQSRAVAGAASNTATTVRQPTVSPPKTTGFTPSPPAQDKPIPVPAVGGETRVVSTSKPVATPPWIAPNRNEPKQEPLQTANNQSVEEPEDHYSTDISDEGQEHPVVSLLQERLGARVVNIKKGKVS